MSNFQFFHTVSCNRPETIFVGDRWFKVVGILNSDGQPVVDALVRKDGSWLCASVYLMRQVRTEVLPGLFVTVVDAGKPSKVRLRLEVEKGVPVTFGSNTQEPKGRIFTPVSEIPFLANHVLLGGRQLGAKLERSTLESAEL